MGRSSVKFYSWL